LGVVIGLSWSTLGFGAEHLIKVALVLYEAPSGETFASDPYVLGTQVTEYSQMSEGSKIYLEAWVTAGWYDGLTGVGVDVTYEPTIVSTADLTFCEPFDPLCRVRLGAWTYFPACPIFYGLPDYVCSESSEVCTTAVDCKACFGGDHDGAPCTIGDKLCSSSGEPCASDEDCKVCVGGDNNELPCVVGAKACRITRQACTTPEDCKVCDAGDNFGQACSIDSFCSDTGVLCVAADDCTVCVGGDRDGDPCDPDADCEGGTCVDLVCEGGSSDGNPCDPDRHCLPGGTCEVSGDTCDEESKVCSDTGEECATPGDCKKCVGGDNNGLVCSDTLCSDTGERCTTANDCKKCVGGDNNDLACATDDDCPPDGTCEVSGETCEENKVCSDTGEACVTEDDCRKCVGGDHDGDPCTIKDTVCSSNGEPCTIPDDCKVCSSNSEPCTTDNDCKKCVGGDNNGLACATDDDCPPDGTCEVSGDTCDVSGDTCDDEDCRAGGMCEVSGETCHHRDCPAGGMCEVSGETCHHRDCPGGGMCVVSGDTCDDADCPGGECVVSGETCNDGDCWSGGTCDVSGELCEDNPEKDCVPVAGIVQDVGGNTLNHGIPPVGWWGRIATIEFDVIEMPTSAIGFLAGQDESDPDGKDPMFAYWGGGSAYSSDISFFSWAVPGGPADNDEDGVLDALDNCPSDYNPGQEDDDDDMVGNVCDNCPDVHNPDQIDTDECVGGLYHGNPCDDDIDCQGGYCTGDGRGDACDNCPDVYNPSQEDTDECVEGPHAGQPCNYDGDCPDGSCQGDGVGDYCDNCPDNLNSDQRDCDRDGLGDACETDGDQDGDGVFDTCDNCPTIFNPPHEVPFDCNGDGDTLDPGEGVGEQCDSDGDGIGDECECPPTDPPQAESPAFDKVRYISMVPGNPGRLTALRVHLKTFPPPFGGFNGTKCWVGQPQQVSENAGKIAHEPGWPDFMSANLQGSPHCMDWSTVGTLHVTDDDIVPAAQPPGGVFIPAIYEVQAIGCECEYDNEANYSAPFTMTTSIWGDLVGTCAVIPCSPPEGVVNMATDVTACLDKFRNLEGAVLKSRADIEPNLPDGLVNISDVTYVLDAFRGFPYPFEGPNSGRCPANSRATYQP